MQTPESPMVKRIKDLSISKEGSNSELSEGGSTGSLYSSKDTLSASQSWLRSRAAYVPEGSPKSPAPTRDQHASLKRAHTTDSFKDESSDLSSNQSQVGGSESSVKHATEERAVTPRGGGIFRIKHASAELLSSSTTLSESQRAQQAQTPPPSPAGADDDTDDAAPSPQTPAFGAAQDPDFETQTLRERARQWAVRDSLGPAHAAELEMLLDLAASTFIPRSSIECVRQIDRGAFGDVHLARLDGNPVAVKVVTANSAGPPGAPPVPIKTKLREMLLELTVLVRIRHPNVVTFWGTATHFPGPDEPGAEPFIGLVFELCKAGSLYSALYDERRPVLTVAQRLSVALDVARGLAYLHERRIDDRRAVVHRDINTRNILLTDAMVAKVADFGCARVLVGSSISTTTISGSPAYMSPEQLMGRDLTPATDTWSFGTILWELMSGRKPWSHLPRQDLLGLREAVCAIGEHLAMTPAITSRFPPKYVRLVRGCLQPHPQDRPTMAHARAVLEEALDAALAAPAPPP